MSEHRVRVGVSRWPDGWNVVVELDGKRSVYDPTFATEAECEAKAAEVSAVLRDRFTVEPWDPPANARTVRPSSDGNGGNDPR